MSRVIMLFELICNSSVRTVICIIVTTVDYCKCSSVVPYTVGLIIVTTMYRDLSLDNLFKLVESLTTICNQI